MTEVAFYLNGARKTVRITPKLTLLRLLRDHFRLTGTKLGCENGNCGACSVIIDDELQNACIYPARNLEGKHVTTIEGLADASGNPSDLQLAFIQSGATQCGYCTPGMIIAGEALLRRFPDPSRQEIRQFISGNLCRCTGYLQIIEAIEATAQSRLEKRGQNAG